MDINITELTGGLSLDSGDDYIPASARVYDNLRNRIISFDLPPETTLSRADLAKEYNVSNTPIREAMLRLEQDGLIKTYPQSKTVVTKIDIPKLNEIHFLRIAVECETIRRAAEMQDKKLIAKLRAIIRMQKALSVDEAEISMFNELDEAFHQTLFGSVEQLGLYRLIQSKSGHLARARRLDLPRGDKASRIISAHESIVDAIENGDPITAQDTMRQHLTGTIARIDTLQAENPNYFQAG